MATFAIIIGTLVGYYSQYVNQFGIPAVQSLVATGIAYYAFMYLKARIAPDAFTPDKWAEGKGQDIKRVV